MRTIDELKALGNFKVEEKKGFYNFTYESGDNKLYVSGNVFGNTRYEVLNALSVLYAIAREHLYVEVKIKELEFNIYPTAVIE